MALRLLFCSLSLCYITLFSAVGTVFSSPENAIYENNIETYLAARGKNNVVGDAVKERIRDLSYTQSRLLRSFCKIPKVTHQEVDDFLQHLSEISIKFEAAELLDDYVRLPSVTPSDYHRLIQLAGDQPHAVLQAGRSIVQQGNIPATDFIEILQDIITLPPSGQWALQGVVQNTHFPSHILHSTLRELGHLTVQQQWVLEKLASNEAYSAALSPSVVLSLKNLSTSNSYTLTGILDANVLSPEKTLHFLESFFLLPQEAQEREFQKADAVTKQDILSLYSAGGAELIHELNRLHDVTDSFGREIGNRRLRWLEKEDLEKLFKRLHPQVQPKYIDRYKEAIEKEDAEELTQILHIATHESQQLLASELTTSNIYILISQGSRLYTSAFRELLTPLLQKRIQQNYHNDFLLFLKDTDPENRYTSAVITHLARKGQLTLFMTKDQAAQRELLKLVAQSAFVSQNSVLQFSASFAPLFSNLGRQARSYFTGLIMQELGSKDEIKANLIQLILEYYLARDTLMESERRTLQEKLATRKKIELDHLQNTPFKEWLADNNLASLSVFHSDDDGYGSFVSNNIELLENGYKPFFSIEFNHQSVSEEHREEVEKLLQTIKAQPYFAMNQLFNLSSKSPIVIDWKKRVNKIQITHSTTMYHGQEQQRFLLKKFLDNGLEMYCQRGHSYWLRRQLQQPLAKLLEDEAYRTTSLQKERFISLGSCGSIGAYFNLGEIFAGNVTLLATVGTGTTTINNTYNRRLFELVAGQSPPTTWRAVDRATASIFSQRYGEDYLLPASLPALLAKLMYKKKTDGTY